MWECSRLMGPGGQGTPLLCQIKKKYFSPLSFHWGKEPIKGAPPLFKRVTTPLTIYLERIQRKFNTFVVETHQNGALK